MHALSHPLSARYDTHHGLANGVLMPYVLAFNAGEIDEPLTRLSRCLELPLQGREGRRGDVGRHAAEMGAQARGGDGVGQARQLGPVERVEGHASQAGPRGRRRGG